METLPPPSITVRGLATAAAGWSLYGFAFATLLTLEAGVPVAWAFGGQLLAVPILAALSVPAWWVGVRRLDRAGWGRRILFHAVAAPLYGAAAFGLFLGGTRLIWGPEAIVGMVETAAWTWFGYVLTYAVQFAIYHVAREAARARGQARVAERAERLARESELQALRAKINPHFLLNALHAISAKITVDPADAREMVSDLGELLRYTLRSSDLDAVTLGQEVRFAEAYLRLQAGRFPHRMRVAIHLAPGVLETPMPPVVLQPLVDNAVKHGVERSPAPTTVTIEVTTDAEGLAPGAVRVGVSDDADGQGGPAPSFGLGLENTDARLRTYFGASATLHAGPRPDGGFRAWFDVPAGFVVRKPAPRVALVA